MNDKITIKYLRSDSFSLRRSNSFCDRSELERAVLRRRVVSGSEPAGACHCAAPFVHTVLGLDAEEAAHLLMPLHVLAQEECPPGADITSDATRETTAPAGAADAFAERFLFIFVVSCY